MSLLNPGDGNKNVTTVYITKVYRSGSQSFGGSVVDDFSSSILPAAQITSAIYRKKAMKAIEKRNRIMGYESEYIYTLCNYSAGNNITAGGLTAEANFFDYIVKYCKMEIKAFKVAQKNGGLSPKLMEFLANPPHPAKGHFSKVFYTMKGNFMCTLERFQGKKGYDGNN